MNEHTWLLYFLLSVVQDERGLEVDDSDSHITRLKGTGRTSHERLPTMIPRVVRRGVMAELGGYLTDPYASSRTLAA